MFNTNPFRSALIFLFVLQLFLNTSCNEDDLIQTENLSVEGSNDQMISKTSDDDYEFPEQKKIVLGKKLLNPYSVKSMQYAFDYYNQTVLGSPFNGKTVVATHKYIKLLPETEEQLEVLDNLELDHGNDSIVLHDFPLDYEVIENGDYYAEPQNDQDIFHPIYTVVPVNYSFKTDIPFEVLDELYEPTEEEYDVETAALVFADWKEDLEADGKEGLTQANLASYLVQSSAINYESPTYQSQGNIEPLFIFGTRYRPEGFVKIENTQTGNISEPLMQAKISIGRVFWWKYTHTDNNGKFVSPKKYRGKVWIRSKWRSNVATVRKSWNELLGIMVSDYLMTIKRSQVPRTRFILSNVEHLWYKGTVHNGIVKYNNFIAPRGVINRVYGANVWVWKNGGSSSTPMLYKYQFLPTLASVAGITQGAVWGTLTSSLIDLVPKHLRPDHIYGGLKDKTGANGKANTARINQLVFHESAHYSHASKAGSWFWANVFASEINNQIAHGNPYHEGNTPTVGAGRRIALAEGWAALVEYRAMATTYGFAWDGDFNIGNPLNYMENFDMYTTPMTVNDDDQSNWFLSGVMFDCLDNQVDDDHWLRNGGNGDNIIEIDDRVNLGTTSFFPIFNQLTSSTHNGFDLKSKLMNSNLTQSTQINDLFKSYGY